MTPHQPLLPSDIILALDVGDKRIGLAVANALARLPRPLTAINRGSQTIHELQALVASEKITVLVVGLPRDINGRITDQTVATEAFVAEIKPALGLPIYWQDEALTSAQAEAELKKRGRAFDKTDIDSLSAVYILEDFLGEHPAGRA